MTKILFNPRILFGLVLIAAATGAILTGATGAFFGDTEASTGNTFAAGTLDLKIDNDSWYNGNRCTLFPATSTPAFYAWVGEADYPTPGTPCDTSFPAVDLDDGFLFFNFSDLKPDDEGEDTISIHVQNDAWACIDLTVTSNDDRSTTEPESLVDEPNDEGDAWDGELAQNLEFIWWADDGDNVLEEGERHISENVQSLDELAPEGEGWSIPLADASDNVWTGNGGEPMFANQSPYYIAKAWCFGTMGLSPVPDNGGVNPGIASGITCNGENLNNETQTDGVELNLAFRTTQARHNPRFLCNPPVEPNAATLTVNKIIVADTVGIGVEDFELHIFGPLENSPQDIIVGDNVPEQELPPGTYTVSEVIIEAGLPPGVTFTTTFGGACDPNTHQVTLSGGDSLVCTITNVENEPTALFEEDFDTGPCLADIPDWDEDNGESCTNGTVAAAISTGDDSVSPNGGRFALLSGNNGYICRSVNAAGYDNLALKYYWRGDSQANLGETGTLRFYTGGTCASPTGEVASTTHALTTTSWSTLQTVNLPDSLDNTSFLIKFTADSNGGNESFRIDGISLTGSPI